MSSQPTHPTQPPSPRPSSRNRSPNIPPAAHRLPSMIFNPLRRHNPPKQPPHHQQQRQQQTQQPQPPPPSAPPPRTRPVLSWLKFRTREATQSILLARRNSSGGAGRGGRGGGSGGDATRIPLTEKNVATFLAEMKRDAGGRRKEGSEGGNDDEDEDGNEDRDADGDGNSDEEVDEVFLDKERIRQKRRGQIREIKERSEKRVVGWLDGVG